MGWLSANWIWIALIGAMLLMHLRHGRMHGGHGGHGSHANESSTHDHGAAAPTEADSTTSGHSHGRC